MVDNYLTKQIITYMGNKRKFINILDEIINNIEKKIKKKLNIGEGFSGSGVLSRLFKKNKKTKKNKGGKYLKSFEDTDFYINKIKPYLVKDKSDFIKAYGIDNGPKKFKEYNNSKTKFLTKISIQDKSIKERIQLVSNNDDDLYIYNEYRINSPNCNIIKNNCSPILSFNKNLRKILNKTNPYSSENKVNKTRKRKIDRAVSPISIIDVDSIIGGKKIKQKGMGNLLTPSSFFNTDYSSSDEEEIFLEDLENQQTRQRERRRQTIQRGQRRQRREREERMLTQEREQQAQETIRGILRKNKKSKTKKNIIKPQRTQGGVKTLKQK